MHPCKIVLTTKPTSRKLSSKGNAPQNLALKDNPLKVQIPVAKIPEQYNSNPKKITPKKSIPKRVSFVDEAEAESSGYSSHVLSEEDDEDEQESAEDILERYKENLKQYKNHNEVSRSKEIASEIFKLQIFDLDDYFVVLGYSLYDNQSHQSTVSSKDKTIYKDVIEEDKRYNWRRIDYEDIWAAVKIKPHKMEIGQSIWALSNIWDILNQIKVLNSASKVYPALPQDLKEYHAGEFRAIRVLMTSYYSRYGQAKERSKKRVVAWMDGDEENITWLYTQHLIMRKKLSLGRK